MIERQCKQNTRNPAFRSGHSTNTSWALKNARLRPSSKQKAGQKHAWHRPNNRHAARLSLRPQPVTLSQTSPSATFSSVFRPTVWRKTRQSNLATTVQHSWHDSCFWSAGAPLAPSHGSLLFAQRNDDRPICVESLPANVCQLECH